MKVQRRVARSAAGATVVTVTVIAEDGTKATVSSRSFSSDIAHTAAATERQAKTALKALMQPELEMA